MTEWNYEEYLTGQVKGIEDLKAKGSTDREILDRNEFCFEALKKCGLPISYLVPRTLPQQMDLQEWDTHTSCEHKWEFYNDTPFGNADERDRVLIGLLYSAGFKHLLDILPAESKGELIELIKNQI